jgi:GAF domain-containing protein
MHSAETLANLQKFLTLLNPSLALEEMLTNVAQQLVEMFGVDHSGVLLFEEEDQEGVVFAEYPWRGLIGIRVPLTDYPLVNQLKTERKSIAVLDAQNDPVMGQAQPTMQAQGIHSILIIPLIVRGKLVGSLSLDMIQTIREFHPEEVNLCQIVGDQIAVAIDYTRALKISEESRQQAQILGEVSQVVSRSLDLEHMLPSILEQLEKVIPVNGSSIFLLVGDYIQQKVYRGPTNLLQQQLLFPLSRMWGAAQIVKNRAPMLIRNVLDHPHWHRLAHSKVRSWLGMPLIVNDEVLGVLNMDGFVPYQFDESHIPLAQAFAAQSALAIYNAQLYQQAQQRANLLALVQEIGLRLTASLNLQNILEVVVTSVVKLLEAGQARIYLYKADIDSFSLAATFDQTGQFNRHFSQPRKNGLTATVARTGQHITVTDILSHPLYQFTSGIYGFRAIASFPLKKSEQVLGVFSVFYSEPHYFSAGEIDALELLATQTALALENARLYEFEVKQIEQEMAIARQIQQGFFPKKLPALAGWTLAAACQPARETGGDFYEFVERSDGLVGIIVGDVSGKSIPAAMLMAGAHSVVRSKGTDYRSPAAVMSETNRLLCDDVPAGAFVAISYALLVPDEYKIHLSSGGQVAPFLVPANGAAIRLIETPGNRLPLGILPELAYEEISLILAPGDTLVFYTDGLIEQHNPAGTLLGFELLSTILETLRGQPPEVMVKKLLEAAGRFAEGMPPHDDITLVIIQRTPEMASQSTIHTQPELVARPL